MSLIYQRPKPALMAHREVNLMCAVKLMTSWYVSGGEVADMAYTINS